MRLLGGLMALGYTIAAILKRSSHIFSDDRVCVKTDWLEQLNRQYVQVSWHFVHSVVEIVLEFVGCFFFIYNMWCFEVVWDDLWSSVKDASIYNCSLQVGNTSSKINWFSFFPFSPEFLFSLKYLYYDLLILCTFHTKKKKDCIHLSFRVVITLAVQFSPMIG